MRDRQKNSEDQGHSTRLKRIPDGTEVDRVMESALKIILPAAQLSRDIPPGTIPYQGVSPCTLL